MLSLVRFKNLKYNNVKIYELIKESIDNIKNTRFNIADRQFSKKFGEYGIEYVSSLKDLDATKIYGEKIYEVRKFYELRKIDKFKGENREVVYYQRGDALLLTKKIGEFVSLFRGGNQNAKFKNAREFQIYRVF